MENKEITVSTEVVTSPDYVTEITAIIRGNDSPKAMMSRLVRQAEVGTLIPLFFKKIKVDPAVASGPLITTVNDLMAVVSYYGLSWLLLLNLMHLGG